ncbi:DUF397 domain-containing protein [Herbidospora sp. RD11066]
MGYVPNSGQLRHAVWVKSSHSNPNGSCVEFARLPDGTTALRNSRDPEGPALVFGSEALTAMLTEIKSGRFDHLMG